MDNCSKCGKAVDLFEVGAICPHCGFMHWGLVFYALSAPFFAALWVAIH